MAKNNEKKKKSNKKVIRSEKKDGKSETKIDSSVVKASEYVENLLELHKLQGSLLVRLQKEFVS